MKKIIMLVLFFVVFLPTTLHAGNYLRIGLVNNFGARANIRINNVGLIVDGLPLHSPNGFVVTPEGVSQIAIEGAGMRNVFEASAILRNAYGEDIISLEDMTFRGAMQFIRVGNTITAVNIIDLERYLFGVVPNEMPPSWHPEALKAQAIVARTYALYMLANEGRHEGFELCDTTHCQVYGGVNTEHINTTQAVLDTVGIVLHHNGEVIEAVYSASSGGMTENSEDVWIEARPYLRSVPDPYEFEPVLWTRAFSTAEMTALLAQNGHNIGNFTSLAITNFTPTGRVSAITITGTTGQITVTGEEIRTFFSQSAEGSLMSRMFNMGNPVEIINVDSSIIITVTDGVQTQNSVSDTIFAISANNEIQLAPSNIFSTNGLQTISHNVQPPQSTPAVFGDVVLSGRGFGHAVGMSQRGAEGMARAGYSFREILTHFYTGAVVVY
ncbi:MAG: SpoIID/LytB domain-containing protein [Turicibacter sp.]|nr:SpoIID/LytB domain-containing protein [Turicibacter sp.]